MYIYFVYFKYLMFGMNLIFFFYFIGLIIEGLGFYLICVWCFMIWKWGFFMFYFFRFYKRLY